MTEINIGLEYNRLPYGRDDKFGSGNGQQFREEFLRPALEDTKIVIDFSDIDIPPGSSFLDEAFAGCVRKGYIGADEFIGKLRIIEHNDFKVEEQIIRYIKG